MKPRQSDPPVMRSKDAQLELETRDAIALLISQGYSLIAPGAKVMPVPEGIPNPNAADPLYTLDEVAKMWRVSYRTVYRYVTHGKLKAFKIGPTYRITESAKREFEHKHNLEPVPV